MKAKNRLFILSRWIRSAVLVATIASVPNARAQTLWTGPTTNFAPTAVYKSTTATTFDLITSDVALARNADYPLFNAKKESTYVAANGSPQNTTWALGTLANYTNLTFKPWASVIGGGGDQSNLITYLPGKTYVVHLVSNNIYLQLTFNTWHSDNQQGSSLYSYTRTTAPPPTPTVSISSPTNGATFTAPASVTIMASASVSSGTVTNVSFFAGTNLLGSVLTAPFNFTASNLAVGTYALTAVATAAGVQGASPVVNITVSPPAPTISITNPVGGAVFAAPANISIAANASVSSGTVTNVSFFTGLTLLGKATAPPFAIIASNLTANAYPLTAVATAAGISTTSAVVNISVVAPVAVSLASPIISGGQFSFTYTDNPGLTYVIQRSSNLPNWVPIATNVPSTSPTTFTDTSGLGARFYYQVVLEPNP